MASVSYHHYSRAAKATLATCWAGAVLYLLFGAHDIQLIRAALFFSI
jgi:hypothetical protein